MVFVCRVTLQYHMIKVIFDLATTLPCLLVIGTVVVEI